jgi:hypothetical protein
MRALPEIVRLLAEASHQTWMRQKERDQGVRREDLDPDVTAHDIERAEDALRVLEQHSLLSRRLVRHWHKEPAPSTPGFVEGVPLMDTPKGVKAVIEITAYAEGTKIAVATSRVEGPNHARTIRQKGSLMFNDLDEAKDAIDAIVDHLEEEAKKR